MECVTTFQVVQPIDLNNPSCQIQILTSFNLHYLANIEGAYSPTEQGHSVSPQSVKGSFSKSFSWQMGDTFFAQIYWETVLHRGFMIRSCQGQESFTNTFSSNLKTVNFKILANHERIYSGT